MHKISFEIPCISVQFTPVQLPVRRKTKVESLLLVTGMGDRTIPIHARTQGSDVHPLEAMGVYYGTVQSATKLTLIAD